MGCNLWKTRYKSQTFLPNINQLFCLIFLSSPNVNFSHLYQITAYYKGYVIWLSVLIILWVCLFAISSGQIIFLRFDLWPSFKICSSKSSGRLLDAARFNQGCAVAFMSVCRIVHLALIISISFDSKAPTYACVEFSFNRRSDGIISYSTPLLEVIQGIFYPIFLLAGKLSRSILLELKLWITD